MRDVRKKLLLDVGFDWVVWGASKEVEACSAWLLLKMEKIS